MIVTEQENIFEYSKGFVKRRKNNVSIVISIVDQSHYINVELYNQVVSHSRSFCLLFHLLDHQLL
jgi:hypothetical protein